MNGGLVSAIDWRETEGKWTCSIVFYNEGYNKLVLTSGSNLSFRVETGRYCTGYYELSRGDEDNFDSWRSLHPCPYDLEITRGTRCLGCRTNDTMIQCIRCDGSTCNAIPDIREKCRKSTTYVYLAAFRNRIKAGVSRDRRILKRWIEQGADAARIVLKGNGLEARRYEKRIQTKLGASNHVLSSQKIVPAKRASIDVSLELLENYSDRVYRLIPDADKVNEEPVNLLPFYRLPEINGRPMPLKVQPGLQINGIILGVKGPILYVEMASQTYALDTHRLLARRIEFGDFRPSNIQSGLERFIS